MHPRQSIRHARTRSDIALILLACAGLWLMAGGCRSPRPRPPVPDPIPLTEALDRYNDNVRAVGAFSARIDRWQAELYEGDRRHTVSESGGKLFFTPPTGDQSRAQLSLRASASFYDLKALILGSNQDEYWMIVTPQKFGLWGRYRNLNKPCAGQLPLDPQQILDLAGLVPIPDQPDRSPYPVYKVLPEQYAIEYVRPWDRGLWLQHEILVDRRTDCPSQIKLYNADGLCIGRSELSDYQAFEGGRLPGSLRLFFTDDNGRENSFQLKLTRFKPLVQAHPLLFQRPENPAGLDSYQQIDRDCNEN